MTPVIQMFKDVIQVMEVTQVTRVTQVTGIAPDGFASRQELSRQLTRALSLSLGLLARCGSQEVLCLSLGI